jgi:ABC-type glycerol-3-phosphate transport system substrate-binding protein
VDRNAFTIPVLATVIIATLYYSEQLTKAPPDDGKVHVKYWEKWTAFEFDAMKHVVDEFNKSQDKIQVDILSVSGIEDKTLMAISGGIPPDVVGLYGENVTQYADNHAVIQLDDMCREAGIKRDDYISPFWDAGVIRGHLYALPSTPATTALHYNRKVFKEVGLDPDKPPRTIDELDDMADKLMKRDAKGHVVRTGFMPGEPGWWNWSWGPFFGGKLWDGKNKITFNSPENVKAFEWVQSFSKKWGASALQSFKSGFGSFSSPQNAFMMSQNAMEIQGVWMYNFIHMYSPGLDWAAAPFPTANPELPDPTVIDLDVLCIPTGAKHTKEAFEFLKFVESQKGLEMLCLGQKKITPLKAVSPGFIENHPNPFIKLFIKMSYSKGAVSTPKLGIWSQYKDEISSAFDDITLMTKTPKQALDDVTNRMQPMLDQYQYRLHLRGEE